MSAHDDELGLKLLGQVQELRHALEHLDNREQARALKPRLVALHEASRDNKLEDVGKIVDEFFTLARGKIVKVWGTAAWDEPETLEEAKARMGTLPSAPGPGVLDRVNDKRVRMMVGGKEVGPDAALVARETAPLTDEELEAMGAGAESLQWSSDAEAARWITRLVAEVRRLRFILHEVALVLKSELGDDYEDLHPADLIRRMGKQLDALRSDEWLRAAARDVGKAAKYAEDWDVEEALDILRKHRDGKA